VTPIAPVLQFGLDVTGAVGGAVLPGIADIADLANAGISALRGDWLGAGLSLGAAVPYLGIGATVGKWGSKADNVVSSLDTLVIGRGSDLAKPGALKSGEFRLSWEPTDSVRTEWKTNSGLLRQEMGNMRPIRDASPGDTGGLFLNLERNLLMDRGWKFDAKTTFWNPPK